MSRLLFRWTDNALIAANTGRCFTPGGLEALCSSHRSDKGGLQGREFASDEEARQKVNELRSTRLAAYKACPGDIVEHARAEREMGLDYTNRLLLELMQNADDAATGDPIGYKGLGFKSVLDVCASARIYSGYLRVRFDREESGRALREAGLGASTEVPVLRLPFWINGDRDAGVDNLLLKEYETVIVLPWKSGAVPQLFDSEWKSICTDASVLLLLHALEKVIWEGPRGEHVEWRCQRGDDIELSVTRSDRAPVPSRWRVHRGSAADHRSAVIVRLDDDRTPIPYRNDWVRVFFPTEEASPLPMVLHGGFDLEQNRKHVRPGGTREEIIQSLGECVRSALTEITDDGRFLDLLRPRIPPENMTGLEREIWDAVSAVVCEMALPESNVKLCELRLCPEAGSQEFPWYGERLDNWKVFKELLASHRSGGLADLKVLLPGTDTEAREETICAYNGNVHLTMDKLAKIAMIPVAGVDRPVASADYHLFFPAGRMATTIALPNVRIAFLLEEFSTDCHKCEPVVGLLKRLGIAEFSPLTIAAALAQSPLEKIPKEMLWDFLRSTLAPMLKEKDAVMEWRNKNRQFLALHVKVPCRNNEWAEAVNVYAGKDWTGDEFLERAYSSTLTRSFLITPTADGEQRKQVEHLARWLGVGWSPKILPIVNFDKQPETREGVQWERRGFPVPSVPMRWQGHCNDLARSSKCNFNDYAARLRQDWTIDGDDHVLRVPGAFESICKEWSAFADYLEAVIFCSSNMRKDNDNQQVHGTSSYVAYLFRHVEWIPVRDTSEKKAAQDVFVDGSEVHKSLAVWVFSPAATVNASVSKGIGIRREWSEVTKGDWQRWLKRSLDLGPRDNDDQRQQITTLYQQALRHFEKCDERLWAGDIWCKEKRSDNTEAWHRETNHGNIYYVDRPDLARLRLEMLRTFPVELGWLGNKERAKQLFEVRPLREHIRGEPVFASDESEACAARILERLDKRGKCLAAYLKVQSKSAEVQKLLALRVGKDLYVTFSIEGEALPPQRTPTFFQPAIDQSAATLWLDTAENFAESGQPRDIAWDEVGLALCYAAGLSLEHGTVFSSLLECGEDSLKRKLLNLGVTEADVANALPPKPQTPDLPQQPAIKPPPSAPPEPAQPERPPGKSDGSILDEMAPDGDIPTRLHALSEALASETPERIKAIVERTDRRDTEFIKTLKQFYEFRCQFPHCGIRIPKKDGGYYIEVAHIEPVRAGGKSVLGNLLVLCPNHHKEFDHGKLEILEQTPEFIHGKLNGREFSITLTREQKS